MVFPSETQRCTTSSHPRRLDVVSYSYSEDICSVNSKVEVKKTWSVISRYFKIHFACQLRERRNYFSCRNQPATFGSMDSGYLTYSVPENSLETMHISQTWFALSAWANEGKGNRTLSVKQLISSELLHSFDQDSFCKPEKLVSCWNIVYCHLMKMAIKLIMLCLMNSSLSSDVRNIMPDVWSLKR